MKVVIFDMYGVILKAPEGDLIPFIRKYFPELSDDSINGLWKEAAYGRKTSYEFFRDVGFKGKIQDIEKEYLETIQIDDNFLNTAKCLKRDYKLVLLSNDLSEWSVYLREKFGLNELFDKIIISGDFGILKPDNRLFNIILDDLQQPASECCYIDDREKNLTAAAQLGMEVILFNRRNVTFDGNIIYDFKELEELIRYYAKTSI